jgi:predicted secreted hydrolase
MICLGVAVAAAVSSHALAATAPPREGTVNSYTPAEERRARDAAARQGYRTEPATWAQAGNFFFTATKDGQRYQLTVTPNGTVHASRPLPPPPTG